MTSLYGGTDMAKVMYGENARHVPAWLYVQDQGQGVVGLVGASKVEACDNPLTYGRGHWQGEQTREGYYPHYLVVGEIIMRPHIVWGINGLQGYGAGSLFLGPHDDALERGELIAGSEAMLRRVRADWERPWWR